MRDPLEKAEVISLKRFSLVFCLVLAMSLVFVGSAFANFGPHGGYATDTDQCAACHRAHTSFSSIEFLNKDLSGSTNALLVGGAGSINQFCLACHGNDAPGASTNVDKGIFDAGPSSDVSNTAVAPRVDTTSHFNAPLNGGGFTTAPYNYDYASVDGTGGTFSDTAAYLHPVTSSHSMESTGVIWGAGAGADKTMDLVCTSCHDPHGSSNYRALKDSLPYNPTVGGYTFIGPDAFDTQPNAWVYGAEPTYPTTDGWLQGPAGQAQIAAYRPNYTGGTKIAVRGSAGTLSGWCSGCHVDYDNTSGAAKNYGSYETTVGTKPRHRHPVDVNLEGGDNTIQIPAMENKIDNRIPLEIVSGGTLGYRKNKVGCLTCHFAHGSSQTMTGWAAASLTGTGQPSGSYVPTMDGVGGVNPDKAPAPGAGTSALLRANNRGVCERCHNK